MKRVTKRTAPPVKKKEPEPQVKTHRLHAWPETFDPIERGERTFDIRLDDRRFKVGERVLFVRWDERNKQPTGATCLRKISYILIGVSESTTVSKPRWGLKAHYIAMGLVQI